MIISCTPLQLQTKPLLLYSVYYRAFLFSQMDTRTEIHTGLSLEAAYKLMEQGHKIAHDYYSDNEFLRMKDGVIYDESG